MLTLTWLTAAGSTSTRQTAVWPTAGSMCTVRTSAIIRKNIIKPHLYYFHRRGSAGEGIAIGHPLPFIDSDALCFQYPWRGGNLAAVYLLAAFVEHTVNGQSIFISVRAKSRRHLVNGILSVSTKFLIIYAFFWLMAGLIGASLFSTGLTIVSFRLMLYAVLMKCLDILVQYLIMLGIYIATRQVTIGFLVLVAGNLLCILPGNWVAYSPFGLSSLTRISVVEPGIGISAVSAFGIEAAILTLMIAGILMWGYKKILN